MRKMACTVTFDVGYITLNPLKIPCCNEKICCYGLTPMSYLSELSGILWSGHCYEKNNVGNIEAINIEKSKFGAEKCMLNQIYVIPNVC